ncbi:protein involved in polysaccharide export with SLBB domain [Arcticibacter pallidicorallinus]|uniref:Protein involved in polysaccharide export with SLBB domain n=2 Tax=Arcticibacter pallidicorallinus TaxID=1259464 RepID=A0A2T0U6Z3_9SPHI|nr:protein involved in polysaccharide export with SLBB domain [Arcticibacter pallidicorallinus]
MNVRPIYLFLLTLIMSVAVPAVAQNTQNFSDIRVDELSDAQIRQFMSQVQAAGLTEAQLEQVAASRGMPSSEVQKLRARVEKLQTSSGKAEPVKSLKQTTTSGRSVNYLDTDSVSASRDSLQQAGSILENFRPKIFGSDLFSGKQVTFEPNLRMATPRNYVIGPDDELLLDIYGNSEASYKLRVSPEGTINVQYVGVIPVGGMTIEQATQRIKSRMSTIYSGLRSGATNLNIAVGNIRSIKVVLTGEVKKPGTYTLPSLATVFNALYVSGGPTDNGSFRQIELIRGGRRIATLDIYDFLLTGEFRNNVGLQDQDVIRVPTYNRRVEIVGEVKRPGIFEMKEGERLSDLFRFAGEFNERAYKARVKVLKNTDTERRIDDITSDAFATYQPASGDKYFVDEILDRFANRVTIEGAVFRPGQFELSEGLTLKGLIQKAEGLKEDAFTNRAYITRLKNNNETELISFDVAKVLSGEAADVPLKREDKINISSIFDLKEEYNVQVEGEVRDPGKLKYAEGMTLEDAILQAGGLKENATTQRVEISRRVKNSDVNSASAITAEVFQVNITSDLRNTASTFVLQPFDIVAIRPSSGYSTQKIVKIEGEVLFPGVYSITRKDERISDLLNRAGGFTAYAYPEGASLKRAGVPQDTSVTAKMDRQRVRQFQLVQRSVSDTIKLDKEALKNDFVGIDLPRILKRKGGRDDIFLEEGDIVSVPKQLQTVKIGGEVLSPVTVVFSRNKGFREYISNAGGFGNRAKRRAAYVVYANGTVQSTSKFLFFNNFPSIKPGAQIFVPKKPEVRRMSAGEWVGLSSGLASVAAIIVSLLR